MTKLPNMKFAKSNPISREIGIYIKEKNRDREMNLIENSIKLLRS